MSQSFPALQGNCVDVLILGTMPGKKSLQRQQYYAHPRNALWPILCAVIQGSRPSYDVHQQLSYEERCTMITRYGIALWDVLASCHRPGSLDGNIVRDTEVPNTIDQFLDKHSDCRTIICNGKTAEKLFNRYIRCQFDSDTSRADNLTIVTLPSTSPAMATLSLEEKFAQWSTVLQTSLQNEARY